MSAERTGYGAAPDVVAPNPGRATVRSLPGGVVVPWLAGLVSLLVVAAGTLVVLGRTGDSAVPRDLVLTRASLASATAESVRKGLDEAVDDLAVLADVLDERDESQWARLMADFVELHDRYPVVYVLDEDRAPSHVAGTGSPRPAQVPDPLPQSPGLAAPVDAGQTPVLQAWVPLEAADGTRRLLVGRYEARFFGVALSQLAPGTAYLVDADRRVVGATTGFLAFEALPAMLDDPAQRVLEGPDWVGDVEGRVVRTASAVRGESPAGRLGLAVVSGVDVRSLALPSYEARRLMVLVSSLAALLSLLSFFWFYLAVVGPVRRVAREAERIAFGDRSSPVHVVRYDEIGLVTRALERCRTLLAGTGRRR